MFPEDLYSTIDWTLICLGFIFLNLHLNFHVINRSLNKNIGTIAIALGIPVRKPDKSTKDIFDFPDLFLSWLSNLKKAFLISSLKPNCKEACPPTPKTGASDPKLLKVCTFVKSFQSFFFPYFLEAISDPSVLRVLYGLVNESCFYQFKRLLDKNLGQTRNAST